MREVELKLLKTLEQEKKQIEKVVADVKELCVRELYIQASSVEKTTADIGRIEMSRAVIDLIDKSMGAIGKQD